MRDSMESGIKFEFVMKLKICVNFIVFPDFYYNGGYQFLDFYTQCKLMFPV